MEIATAFCGNTLSKQDLVKQTEHIFLPDIPVGMYLSRLSVDFGNFLLVKTLFKPISVDEGKRCKNDGVYSKLLMRFW